MRIMDPIIKKIIKLNKNLIKSEAKYVDQKLKFPIHITKFLKKKDLFKLLGYHCNKKSLSPIDECSFYYEISKYCSSIRNYFLVSIGMVGSAIFKFGTSRQIKIYINKIINENGVASLAITEKDSGSDINSIKSSYKFDGKNYILNGKKSWITL
jgi:alkylation response protein AidB-like acyl-CoA dehydrogenase